MAKLLLRWRLFCLPSECRLEAEANQVLVFGVPKTRNTFLGVLSIMIIAYWGLYLGLPIFGNSQLANTFILAMVKLILAQAQRRRNLLPMFFLLASSLLMPAVAGIVADHIKVPKSYALKS